MTDSRRRRSWNFRRLSVPGASDPLPRSREPFDRLKFWTIHPLRKRLAQYEATSLPSVFRHSHWATLRYWALLLDEDDEALITFAGFETELPDPDEWFGKVVV